MRQIKENYLELVAYGKIIQIYLIHDNIKESYNFWKKIFKSSDLVIFVYPERSSLTDVFLVTCSEWFLKKKMLFYTADDIIKYMMVRKTIEYEEYHSKAMLKLVIDRMKPIKVKNPLKKAMSQEFISKNIDYKIDKRKSSSYENIISFVRPQNGGELLHSTLQQKNRVFYK